MSLRIVALALFTILFCSDVFAQCPGGHFRIGPLGTNRSIGAGLPSQLVATACISLETTEELATVNAVVFANLSHAQALADRLVANLGSVTARCTTRTLGSFKLAISTATLESIFGESHIAVTGTARSCLAEYIPIDFTVNMPVRFVVTAQKSLIMAVDRPTTNLPPPINGFVSSKIYQQAQAYAQKIHLSLPALIPKEVFLLNPQLGDVTVSYGNDALSARVPLTARISSAAVTQAINDKLQAESGLHF